MDHQKVAEQQKQTNDSPARIIKLQNGKRNIPVWFILTVGILTLFLLFGIYLLLQPAPEPQTINDISMEEILNISELSTVSSIYKGIADVRNNTRKNDTDYYVSYKAEVLTGIDIEKIQITQNDTLKTVHITLPPVKITNVSIDPDSWEFLFINERANTADTVKAALDICKADINRECEPQNAITIYELAEANAKKAVEALVKPILGQLKEPYELIVE